MFDHPFTAEADKAVPRLTSKPDSRVDLVSLFIALDVTKTKVEVGVSANPLADTSSRYEERFVVMLHLGVGFLCDIGALSWASRAAKPKHVAVFLEEPLFRIQVDV